MNAQLLSDNLQRLLQTKTTPVAVAFRDKAPAEVPRINTAQPAGCGYWRVAAEKGEVFFTEAADHFNCPIGAHTHGVSMPAEVGKQLEGLITTMVGLKYLKMADIPQIPSERPPSEWPCTHRWRPHRATPTSFWYVEMPVS